MGPVDVVLQVGSAIDFWHPKYIVQTGVAWGVDSQTQRFADVLVSFRVVGYGNNTRRGREHDIIRDDTSVCGRSWRTAFREIGLPWNRGIHAMQIPVNEAWFPSGSRDGVAKVDGGLLIGAGFLIDDLQRREEIIAAVELRAAEKVRGGDMESYALARTAAWHSVEEWIVVKGISDWADGKKHKAFQPLAAAMAVRVVQALLGEL